MGVDASAVASVLGVETKFEDLREGGVLFLPQRIAVFAQAASDSVYSLDKFQITSAVQAGQRYGWGSPIHLIARELFPSNGDGVGTIPVTVYPLEDVYDTSVAASGTITPSGAASKAGEYQVVINNIKSEPFVIDDTDTVETICDKIKTAIDAVLAMPVTVSDDTTHVSLTAKWAGESGNDLHVEVVGEDLGVTFAVVQPSGGLVNPDLTDALDKMGNVWESLVLNALNISDTDALDVLQTVGDGRWGELVRKPFVAFTGNTATSVASATIVSSARRTDKINAQLVAPGSKDLPFVVAARQLARIAAVANNNPPVSYQMQRATGLTPGDDGDQWDYEERDQAVKAGSSTIEVKDSVINIADVVTFYRPEGEAVPAYRYVNDIVKLQNIIFNIDLIFASQEWAAAVLIPNDQPNVNKAARKPKSAIAEVTALHDSLGLNAIISDPTFAKKNTTASIDSMNPKRLNLTTKVKLSGNANIIDVELGFGFHFGTPAVVG